MAIFSAVAPAQLTRVLVPPEAPARHVYPDVHRLGAQVAAALPDGAEVYAAFISAHRRAQCLAVVTGSELVVFGPRIARGPEEPLQRVPLDVVRAATLSFRTGLARKAFAGAVPSLELALVDRTVHQFGFAETGSATRTLMLLRNAVAIATGADKQRFWIDATVVTCHGLTLHPGEAALLAFGDLDAAVFVDGAHRGSIAYRNLRTVDVAGGEQRSDAGIIGGGFGLEGAAKGILTATVINNLSNTAGIGTALHVSGPQVDATFATAEALPADLDIVIPAVRASSHAGDSGVGPADPVERLERLHSLHRSGALSSDEFDTLKAELLGTSTGAGTTETDALRPPQPPFAPTESAEVPATPARAHGSDGGGVGQPQSNGDQDSADPRTRKPALPCWPTKPVVIGVIVLVVVIMLAAVLRRDETPPTMQHAELIEYLRSNLTAADGSDVDVDTLDCEDGVVRDGEDVECSAAVRDGTLRVVVTPTWDGESWHFLLDVPDGGPTPNESAPDTQSTTAQQATAPQPVDSAEARSAEEADAAPFDGDEAVADAEEVERCYDGMRAMAEAVFDERYTADELAQDYGERVGYHLKRVQGAISAHEADDRIYDACNEPEVLDAETWYFAAP